MFTITQKDLAYAPATTLMELFKLRVITPVDVLEAQKKGATRMFAGDLFPDFRGEP